MLFSSPLSSISRVIISTLINITARLVLAEIYAGEQFCIEHLSKISCFFLVPGANRRHPTWLTDESAELPTAKVATSERCRRPLEWTIGRLLGITTILYSYVSRRIIRCNSSSIIIITTITINSIPISPSRTAWTLSIIDWRRGVPSSNNIRQRSINFRMNSAKSSRPATRDLALTKTITTTISKIDIIIIIRKRGIRRRDTITSNAGKDYRRKVWRSLMIGTGSWSGNVGSWQRAASPYLKIER